MAKTPARRKRPSGVSLAAWLHLAQWVSLLATGGYMVWGSGALLTPGGRVVLDLERLARQAGVGSVFVVLSLPVLVTALGLFWLRRWAWLLGMTIQALGLASALIAYLVGRPNYLQMALGTLIYFTLNQVEVRRAFQPRPGSTPPERGAGAQAGSREAKRHA